MDILCPLELKWLLDTKLSDDREHYEFIAHAVSVGYVRTQTKKKVEMFEKTKVGRISKSQKQKELEELNKIFSSK